MTCEQSASERQRYQLFFFGTFLPSLRASDSPIAIACFGLVTFFPLRPLFSRPRFISCISRSTSLLAEGLYFLELDFLLDFFAALFRPVDRLVDRLDFFDAAFFVPLLPVLLLALFFRVVLFLLPVFLLALDRLDDFFADLLLAFFVAITILPMFLRGHQASSELHPAC